MHSDVEGRQAGGATPASAVLPLNVGGVPFATTRATLCSVPDSMLASMFSGRFHVERDETGRYFINFLRTGALPQEVDDNDGVRRALAAEADFYQLRELAACLTRNFLALSDSPHLLGSFTFQLPGREWLWAPAAPPAAAAAARPGEGEAGEAGVAVGPPGLYLLLASVCARVADDAPRGKMEGCAQLLVNGTVCSLTHGPEYGLFCTVHFAELLHLQRHDAVTVRAVDLPIAQMPALKGAAVPSRLALLPLPTATPALQAFGVGHCEDSDVMKWGCARLPPSGLGLDADGQVEVRQAGTYLLLAKTCVECAAYHATAARLVLNGECFAELDHRSAGANHQKLQSYFHDVLYLPVGAQLRLHTGALAAAPPDHLANRLNLIYVGAGPLPPLQSASIVSE